MEKQPDPPEISFIVPCYRCRRTVGFTLKSILEQEIGRTFEILLVDSSPGGISNWVRSTYPRVKVISSERRLGAGAARNLGAEEASGQYIAFLDADVLVSKDWLRILLEKLETDPETTVAGGSIANANPEKAASRVLHWVEFSEFLPGLKSGPRNFLSSSNCLIRKSDFQEAGGFSPDFSMAEDLELFTKGRFRLYFDADAQVRHFHRSRWKTAMQHLASLGFWSGTFRRKSDSTIPGAWLKEIPAVCWLLVPYRTVRILTRIWRHNFRDGLKATLHFPLVTIALVYWTNGFYRGLTNSRIKSEQA
jgi:glycosyltransferase involved in cell wall biosynthesis